MLTWKPVASLKSAIFLGYRGCVADASFLGVRLVLRPVHITRARRETRLAFTCARKSSSTLLQLLARLRRVRIRIFTLREEWTIAFTPGPQSPKVTADLRAPR
jgi:hypothetical protein